MLASIWSRTASSSFLTMTVLHGAGKNQNTAVIGNTTRVRRDRWTSFEASGALAEFEARSSEETMTCAVLLAEIAAQKDADRRQSPPVGAKCKYVTVEVGPISQTPLYPRLDCGSNGNRH